MIYLKMLWLGIMMLLPSAPNTKTIMANAKRDILKSRENAQKNINALDGIRNAEQKKIDKALQKHERKIQKNDDAQEIQYNEIDDTVGALEKLGPKLAHFSETRAEG